MVFLPPLLAASLLGFLFLSYILRRNPVPFKSLLLMSAAPAVGLALCSLILFTAYALYTPQAKFFSFCLYGILTAFLAFKTFRDFKNPFSFSGIKNSFVIPKKENWPARRIVSALASLAAFLLFFGIFVHFIKMASHNSAINIYGGWDTRFFWNVKAAFYFRDPLQWKNMFSPIIAWTHPDYPLMLPGSVAWGWNWIGQELPAWPAIVAIIFILSLTFTVIWYLLTVAPAWSAWLAAAFLLKTQLYPFWAVTQYADVPFCFFVTFAGILLIAGARMQNEKLFFLSGWAAVLAAWTKNEGLFFMAEIAAVILLMTLVSKLAKEEKKRWILGWLKGAAVPFLILVVFKLFFGRTGDYMGSSRTLHDYFGLLFGQPNVTRIIAQAFPAFLMNEASWNGWWYFFAAAVPAYFVLGMHQEKSYAWGFALLTILMLAGYFIVLHLTPHEIRWQITTALYRLLLHAGVLALLFFFETFSPRKTFG